LILAERNIPFADRISLSKRLFAAMGLCMFRTLSCFGITASLLTITTIIRPTTGFVASRNNRYQASTTHTTAPVPKRLYFATTTTTRLQSSIMSSTDIIPGRPTWQQTMLRIKDPKKSIAFYRDLMGFTLIDQFDFPQYKFSLYFLTTLPQGETYNLTPGSQQAHDYLWKMDGVALELTYNHGAEEQEDFQVHPGNQENDGFGHIAVK
jgi:lactoylglutathione lyase